MDTFEKILLDYGGYVLICVRYVFKETEEYERCAEINKVLKKYNVSTTMTAEDWQAEMWRRGTSGEAAMCNAKAYFYNAMKMCDKAGMLDKFKKKYRTK